MAFTMANRSVCGTVGSKACPGWCLPWGMYRFYHGETMVFALGLTMANQGGFRGDPNTEFAMGLPWVKPWGNLPPWFCNGFHNVKGRYASFPDSPLVLPWSPMDLPWADAMLSSGSVLSSFLGPKRGAGGGPRFE